MGVRELIYKPEVRAQNETGEVFCFIRIIPPRFAERTGGVTAPKALYQSPQTPVLPQGRAKLRGAEEIMTDVKIP